jgi:hypothetical protein
MDDGYMPLKLILSFMLDSRRSETIYRCFNTGQNMGGGLWRVVAGAVVRIDMAIR